MLVKHVGLHELTLSFIFKAILIESEIVALALVKAVALESIVTAVYEVTNLVLKQCSDSVWKLSLNR